MQRYAAWWALVGLVLAWGQVLGQAEKASPINADRPGYGVATATVLQGHWQAETGLDYQRFLPLSNEFLPYSAELRYGLSKRAELLAFAVYEWAGGAANRRGFLPLQLGGKAQLAKSEATGRSLLLHGTLGLPLLASKPFQGEAYQADLRLVGQNQLFPRVSVDGNLGAFLSSEELRFQYSAQSTFQLAEVLTLFGELYGFQNLAGSLENFFDMGLMYSPKPHWQWDVSWGRSWAGAPAEFLFLSAGLSLRFQP